MKIISEKDSRTILKNINFFCGQNAFHELSGLSFGAGEDDIHQLKTVSVTVKISNFSIHCFTQFFGNYLDQSSILSQDLHCFM